MAILLCKSDGLERTTFHFAFCYVSLSYKLESSVVFFNVFFSRLLARKSFQSFFSLVSSLRSQRTVQALLENELASCIPSDYRYSLGLAYRQRDSPLGFGNYLNLPRASWSVLLPQRTEINCVTDEVLLLEERGLSHVLHAIHAIDPIERASLI